MRTIVPGISLSDIICCAYTVLPMSRLTRRLDGKSAINIDIEINKRKIKVGVKRKMDGENGIEMGNVPDRNN